MTVVIANLIEFVAALIQTGSGAIKKKSRILLVQILQLMLQAVSMALQGGMTGAVSNILSCYRNYLCYKEKLTLAWKIILTAVSVVMTLLLNDQGILGFIPVAVCTVYIFLMDVKDPVQFKLLVTMSFVPWIFYHFALKLYVGAIFDVATVITNSATLLAMAREGKKSRK